MASTAYNDGLRKLLDGTIVFSSATIKVMLVKAAYTLNKNETSMATASTGPTANEISATGYTGGFGGAGRKALSGKAITVSDTTNHKIRITATDPSAWTLGGASNDTIAAAIVFQEGASDAASVPLFYLDPTDLTTNGSNVQLSFDATNGIYTITNS